MHVTLDASGLGVNEALLSDVPFSLIYSVVSPFHSSFPFPASGNARPRSWYNDGQYGTPAVSTSVGRTTVHAGRKDGRVNREAF